MPQLREHERLLVGSLELGTAVSVAARSYQHFVLWSRRGSAILINVWIVGCAVTHDWWLRIPVVKTLSAVAHGAIPPWNLGLALAVLWYAFLSQLKIRWVLALPVYLIFFPAFKLFCVAAKPGVRALRALFDPSPNSEPQAQIPTKRIWLILFFTWIVAFRGLDIAWASWILPVLAVPIWLYVLKVAYKASVAPITFVKLLLEICGGLLDSYMKSLREAKTGAKRDAWSAYLYRLVQSVMRRYSTERVMAVIHREAIGVFSVALLAAFSASACFWALVARALMRTSMSFASSYHFFTTGSWFEAVPWAFGCMTTTVAMPMAGAPVWVKALHVLVLLTGIFQLTYLLACFSIMASAESNRIAGEADKLMQQTEAKLRESHELEVVTLQVGTISTTT